MIDALIESEVTPERIVRAECELTPIQPDDKELGDVDPELHKIWALIWTFREIQFETPPNLSSKKRKEALYRLRASIKSVFWDSVCFNLEFKYTRGNNLAIRQGWKVVIAKPTP
jgi:hypothetical protein